MRRLVVWVALASLLGCEEAAPPTPYPVRFIATADPGEPLAGVSIAAGGVTAVTDTSGTLAIELSGAEGLSIPVTATCPDGHRLAVAPSPLMLRRVIDLATGAPAVLQVTISCPPTSRHGIVVIRAGGTGVREGIPVMVDGREAARTDRSGVAHVALDMAAGSTFQVQLATSTVLPTLRPADPSMPFTFRDADEIFVFDRPFDEEAPPPPPRRHGGRRHTPPAAAPVHVGPVNIGRH